MKTFEFTLSEPLKYHGGGENTESCELELTAPSVKNRKHVNRLQQGFMRCAKEFEGDGVSEEKKEKEDEEKEPIDPAIVIAGLQMGPIDYVEYVDTFIKLVTNGVCRVNAEVGLTLSMAEDMSCRDMERLMGEYLVNFILGSLE